MAENIKVNALETASRLKDNDRVLALTDEVNNEVKTISTQNLITSLISTAENNLITNNNGLFVNGNTINELVEILKQIQAQQADEIGRPIITLSNNLLDNEIWLEGNIVSRSEYAQLFEIYGEKYGAGDGSTTFKLPDYRNRAIYGASNFGYIDAALPNITGNFIFGGDAGTHPQIGSSYANGAFQFISTSSGRTFENTGGGQNRYDELNFSASRSNPIYKDGATVLTPGIKHRVKTRFK